MGLKQVSFVESLSLSQRVPYQRFHCTASVSLFDLQSFTYIQPGLNSLVCIVTQGTVIIIANHGDRIDIPSGAMLENKIVSGNLRILDH